MDIIVKNCNNIENGSITISEGLLNLKYAINGTGKSTIARAIEASAKKDEKSLIKLTPYKYLDDGQEKNYPMVEGLPEDTKIAVFDERYVNQYVFLEDELLMNSFEVFIKTKDYEQRMAEIDELISSVHTMFDKNPELDSLLQAMGEFVSCFGSNVRTGIASNSPLAKGMVNGNIIQNIPQGLEEYSVFLSGEQNSKWLKWQANGREYMDLDDRCPFCAREIETQRSKIERIKNEYDAKTIEHLSRILGLFEKLGEYFTEETNARVREITMSVKGLSDEQKTYLVSIKNQVNTLFGKLNNLKNLDFDLLKDIDKLAVAVPSFKIELQLLTHLDCDFTAKKVQIINSTIDSLYKVVGQLQGAVNVQKRIIENAVLKNCTEINNFLQNAGYNYSVSIDETQDHSYKLLLKFGEGKSVSGVKEHLSFGERNAFALVLFMYQALHDGANFIVLDDPISSFDKNKKFAILDMLFIRSGSNFKGKTTLLLTHDFEPVIDAIYNHSSYFHGNPVASFLENNDGILTEKTITKSDILSSVLIADQNIERSTSIIIKLIFLRRRIEIVNGKTSSWHLLSNLFHQRTIPSIGTERPMTMDEIENASAQIKEYIPEFDYYGLLLEVSNRTQMINLYDSVGSRYEKLQIYRIINGATDENHILRKFINETYHIENDYLFQLNPSSFNIVPKYIIDECDKSLNIRGI